jgi:hypothetical protein
MFERLATPVEPKQPSPLSLGRGGPSFAALVSRPNNAVLRKQWTALRAISLFRHKTPNLTLNGNTTPRGESDAHSRCAV